MAVGELMELERDGRGAEARPCGRRRKLRSVAWPQVRPVPLAVRVVQPAVAGGRRVAVEDGHVRAHQVDAVSAGPDRALHAGGGLERRRQRARHVLELDRVHRLALQ